MKQQNFIASDPFFFNTGQKAESIQEFLAALKNLGNENFELHINEEKNDFASWIRYSMHNHELANKISDLSEKEDIINCIKTYLGIKNIPGLPTLLKNKDIQLNK